MTSDNVLEVSYIWLKYTAKKYSAIKKMNMENMIKKTDKHAEKKLEKYLRKKFQKKN